jgi:hypothetical protein
MANESILRYFILWYCAIKGLNRLLTGLGYAILTRDFPVFSLSPTAFRVKCLLQDCGRKPVTEEISGLIERVTFHSDESGFCVLRVRTQGHREETTAVGSLPSVTAGEWLVAEGWWVRDKEHGLQFKARSLKTVPPTTVEGIEPYLGGGSVTGIGPILAKKLVERFGAEVLAVIENQIAEPQTVDGIGPKRRERIEAAWRSLRRVTYPRYRCRGRFFGRRGSCESLPPPPDAEVRSALRARL